LVGADDLTDIAVLEILAPQEVLAAVPPLPLGITKDLKVGQAAFALGNPFGTGPTVSAGVIHAPRRSVSTPSGRLIDSVIQTDISIHSGNSGGPLIDSSGRVIGINTLIFGDPRELLGLGFALSSEVVQDVASQLTTTGRVSRPWLGAKLQAVEPALAGILGLPVERGAMITDVVEKGPVDRAGMRGCNKELRLGNRRYPVGGDIIVAIDGEGVESDAAVIQVLSRKKPGEEVLVSFYREERLRRFRVRLEEKPADSRR
jgi:S1-C subfamily serine protease